MTEELRRQIVQDVPRWSAWIQQESVRFGYPYIDMVGDFAGRVKEARSTKQPADITLLEGNPEHFN